VSQYFNDPKATAGGLSWLRFDIKVAPDAEGM